MCTRLRGHATDIVQGVGSRRKPQATAEPSNLPSRLQVDNPTYTVYNPAGAGGKG